MNSQNMTFNDSLNFVALDIETSGLNFIENEIRLPYLALVVSGGHTEILYTKDNYHFEVVGKTRDGKLFTTSTNVEVSIGGCVG